MLFSGINIRKELIKHRTGQPDLLFEVNDLLTRDFEKDRDIQERLNNNNSGNDICISTCDAENIFSLDDIKKICILYRLRFLDSTYFKSEYPYNAFSEIKSFEKKYEVKIQSFKIIAPSEAFNLENINKDPLLFAQLSENNFYLLHQWGSDMKWYRKILAWPLQNLKHMLFFLLAIGTVFSFALPDAVVNVASTQGNMYLRIWLSIHIFIGLTGLTLWAGLSFDKTFSEMSWNSKFYNY